MTNEFTGVFPPNTLYRLTEVVAAGTWESPNQGVFPNQRLLVVTATYRNVPIHDTVVNKMGGKMHDVARDPLLAYGDRNAYVDGLDDILAQPVLTMEQEFAREHKWVDWQGVDYTLREEWAYVIGPAQRKTGCSPGIRDDSNDGRTPIDFLRIANEFVMSGRKLGRGVTIADDEAEERAALLTLDEVLAIRLYSGPAYQPINNFCRAIAKLKGEHRRGFAHSANLTFAATTRQIICGLRKLSAASEVSEAPLYRAVRGMLPPAFQVPDEMGMIIATEFGFLSASRAKATALGYMAGNGHSNVLWTLKPSAETTIGYHFGADIKSLSQFAGEEEVLFPPCTMLMVANVAEVQAKHCDKAARTVTKTVQERGSLVEVEVADEAGYSEMCVEAGKHFISVEVVPTFV